MVSALFAVGVTRHTTLPTSSATNSAPARSTATPTGLPWASPLSLRNPLRTSSGDPGWLTVREGHKNHFIAAARYPVPRPMLTNECATGIVLGQQLGIVEC